MKRYTKFTLKQVAHLLATDDLFTEKALVALWRRQVEIERKVHETFYLNDRGFQVADARLFSRLAEKVLAGQHLSEEDLREVRRPWARPRIPIPTICKYRRQVLQILEENARRRAEA